MIWHIFKKDWKLLWPLVLLVALAHVATESMTLILGHFNEPADLASIRALLNWTALIGIVLLTIVAVQQDAVPGDRQDWLTRPFRRRDVLLAKLLFVGLAVQGPLFLVLTAQSLGAGLPLTDSLGAGLEQTATVFFGVSLPALLLASVTRNLIQAVYGALGLTVVLGVLSVLQEMEGMHGAPFARSGVLWLRTAAWILLALLAVIAILPPLYAKRRHLLRARIIFAGAAILVLATDLVPWRPMFAVQQWFSPDPASARPIMVAFDPGLGRSRTDLPPSAFTGNGGAEAIQLPLRVSGLTQGSMLFVDRADIRLVGADGTVLYHRMSFLNYEGAGPIDNTRLEVHQTGQGEVSAHQVIFFPPGDFARLKNQKLRLDIDYSLTRLSSGGVERIAALGGDAQLAEFGWCKTRMDPEGDDVQLGCLPPAYPTGCLTVVLENPVTGGRNPPLHGCDPDYKPWTASIIPGRPLFRVELPFRDLHGLAHYPVDGAQLGQAKVTMEVFSPQAHFTRRLTIPNIRLSDWETEPRQAEANANAPPG